jgi:predicted dehydrogenase
MDHAYELHKIATEKGLMLGSAPCSFLSETAQTLAHAIKYKKLGKPYLIYAELDDDFVPQAPYKKWISESGAPWPYVDEFKVGCTLEHAGYYLTWLMAIFGSVEKISAASANLIDNKLTGNDNKLTAPDYSSATIFFKSGIVARLTCSIIAPHDHRLRVFCEKGIINIDQAWDNSAKVKMKKRFSIRRRLITSPLAKTLKLKPPTHIKVDKKSPTPMNFALGPFEMLTANSLGIDSRVSADFALHLNEVTLAIQNSGSDFGCQIMKTSMPDIPLMSWAE